MKSNTISIFPLVTIAFMAIALILLSVAFGASAAEDAPDAVNNRPYDSIEGVVTDITTSDGNTLVWIESETKGQNVLVVSESTYLAGGMDLAALSVGDLVTGFYKTNAPMIMIYPPQYALVAMRVVGKDGTMMTLDVFDENMLNLSQSLKLNIGENTVILNRDGQPYEGPLSDVPLLVSYFIMTKSIPAQTPPIEIIVLSDIAS